MNGMYGNNQMNQQGYFGQQPQPGYGMYTQAPVAKIQNMLTKDEVELLNKKGHDVFKLTAIDATEMAASKCSHKKDGNYAAFENGDGTVTCTVCGERFQYVDFTSKEVEALVAQIIDVLQTTKALFHDIPVEAAREYMMIIPLLKKLPKLWDFALQNFNKYDVGNIQTQNQGSGFGMLGQILGGGMMGGFQNQSPMYSQQYGQFQQPQGMFQQPQMQQQYGYGYPQQQMQPGQPMQSAPGQNPFGYVQQQQQMGQTAPTPQYYEQPVQAQQQQQQQAVSNGPVQTTTVTPVQAGSIFNV